NGIDERGDYKAVPLKEEDVVEARKTPPHEASSSSIWLIASYCISSILMTVGNKTRQLIGIEQEISEPMDPHPISDQPQPQALYNAAQSGMTDPSTHNASNVPTNTHGFMQPHPDPSHVYNPNANQPTGAMDVHDPKSGVQAGQMPLDTNQPISNTENAQGSPAVQVVETKLPFKEQLTRNQEEKDLGKKILAGDVPPPPHN
ncbi:15056_t:CDS:2, partial [Acaulospora colombiana]